MVVSFGSTWNPLLAKPTADGAKIVDAIDRVPLDRTGIERTFTAVAGVIHRWGVFKDSRNHGYRTMVIVVTDEIGDDEEWLEDAIGRARKVQVPVFILGSQALFGRKEGYVDYVDPETKHVFPNVPVTQGPESLDLEQIRLPFWSGGLRNEIVDAGFGPYALSRLATMTGGIYFVTRFDTNGVGFDPDRMREYAPDWVRRDEYEKMIHEFPLRQAVRSAARITHQQEMLAIPSLDFPLADSPAFKESMTKNQALVELTRYTVEEALVPINVAAKSRDREKSRRWQAHFDLIRGRLLAVRVRCIVYNWTCGQMKTNPPRFNNARSNSWKLVPDPEVRYSDRGAAAAREAQWLLRRVIEEHPATPWAQLAQRELENPLGFKWVETYVPPQPRNSENEDAKRKISTVNEAKPAEVPKL